MGVLAELVGFVCHEGYAILNQVEVKLNFTWGAVHVEWFFIYLLMVVLRVGCPTLESRDAVI